jgi:hypothetical protein
VGLENFGAAAQESLHRNGYLLVDEGFELGRVLFTDIGSVVTIKDRRTGRQGSFTIASYLVIGSREDRLSYNSPWVGFCSASHRAPSSPGEQDLAPWNSRSST